MKAVIMAGGEGTRLRPMTCSRPKPLVPVANKPVMEHIVELLKRHHIINIASTLQYMPDLISEYFGDGDSFGVRMRYFIEKKPLGTAGSVKNAEEFLDDTFLVISGDALTDIDIRSVINYHVEKRALATLVLKKVDIPLEYGVVVTDQEGRIIRFLEKPSWGEVFSDTVNTGIYVLSPEIFQYIRPNEVFDFSKDLFPILLKENKRIYGYITEDYWCDIGDIGAYIEANADVLSGKVRVTVPGHELGKGIWVGCGTEIGEGVKLNAPILIGAHCHIKNYAEIGSLSVIGDNTVISEQCGIKRSIIGKNCNLSSNVQLRGSILCNHVHIKEGVSAFEQSVIGDNTLIKERAIIRPSIKIWPDKLIGQGMEVDSNLVWGSKAGRQIFGNRGISGEINIDITPEFAAKLGASYGAVIGNKGNFGVSSDNSPAALMTKNALISGLLSSGIHVNDLKRLILPALRSAIRFYRLDGGIHISSGANLRLDIDFLDKTGSSIDRGIEKKIENTFSRDDFSRCEGDCLKSVTEIEGFDKFYLKSIIHGLKSNQLKYKILLNTSSEYISQILTELLVELGCTVETVNMKKSETMPAGVNDLCNIVRRGEFHLGVSIEESCEKMMLIDDDGRVITEDMFIALITLILFKKIQGGTVIVPITASQAVDKIADEYHGIVVRAKTSPRDMIGKLLTKDVKEELLEQFTMHFDAIAGLAKLLDYMSLNQVSLSAIVNMLPEIHMHRQEVECRWDAKGKVMRQLIQENDGKKVETLEGVKVYNDNGWVLVLPDSEKPVCTVISEGMNAEFAEELTNIYARKVREISRS